MTWDCTESETDTETESESVICNECIKTTIYSKSRDDRYMSNITK